MLRAIWLTGGLLALALGIIGILLPLVPTTPFVLIAAMAFSKSSKTFSDYLISNKYLGPMIRDWQKHRTIPRRVLVAKVVIMVLSIIVSLAYLNR